MPGFKPHLPLCDLGKLLSLSLPPVFSLCTILRVHIKLCIKGSGSTIERLNMDHSHFSLLSSTSTRKITEKSVGIVAFYLDDFHLCHEVFLGVMTTKPDPIARYTV